MAEEQPQYRELTEEERRTIAAWAASARRLSRATYEAVMAEMDAAYERQQAERDRTEDDSATS